MNTHIKLAMLASTVIFMGWKHSALAAEDNHTNTVMERVMVIGSAERAEDITGSAQFIDSETLDQNNYTDINRVLRQVPGVNLQEEEGYGNRPNIVQFQTGFSVQIDPESLSSFSQNDCPVCSGFSVQFGPEYSPGRPWA